MDAKKTGRFIAELRRQKGYTQKKLADKLMVTDKAVSRWETGKGLPDTSLLKDLSDILGISVGELLSGEMIEEAHMKEKTDQIIMDSLKYSKQMLTSIINILLIIAGGVFILLPLFICGGKGYIVLGTVLICAAILYGYLSRKGDNMKSTKKVVYGFALLCQLAALVLEALPNGVILIFASGPNERITETFSYFSMTPFGYANFFPLPTALLTVAVIVLCIVSLLKSLNVMKIQNAAFICSVIAIILSIMPLLLFGKEYMSAISYTISALMLLSIVFQAVANRHLNKARK